MSGHIVPQHNMDNLPISGLEELQAHIQVLVNDPSAPFNAKLFDDVELQLTEDNIPPLLPVLLPSLTTILKSTTQDPTPCLTLTIKLLSPLSLTSTLQITDPPSLITALQSPLAGANHLALAILHKGAATIQEAARVAVLQGVVDALIRMWLQTEDTGVAEKAARVIGDLLETDCAFPWPAPRANGTANEIVFPPRAAQPAEQDSHGYATLWNFIFSNRSIFKLFPKLCNPSESRTNHQVTLAQGRLLRLLPRLATINLRDITWTPFPDELPTFPRAGGGGILQWASLYMVDKTDILMHLNLVDFFETFVSVMRVAGTRSTTQENSDAAVAELVRKAVREDAELESALRSLPNRTVQEEAEPLRQYIDMILH
jgi:hypothetical protein